MHRPRTHLRRRELVRPVREAATPPRLGAGEATFLTARRPAMGSFFEIRLDARLAGGIALAERVFDLVDELESQLTIYRDDSEVARLNARAASGPIAVERRLFELIERSVARTRDTGGAFDVATGALSRAWGFLGGGWRVPDAAVLAAARVASGSRWLRLNSAAATIEFSRPGVEINLGAVGKGYALDRAAALVRDYWLPTGALIHSAQSSIVAVGSPPDAFGGRWPIALRNPFAPACPLGTVFLRDRALGTSGAAFQQFESNGRRFGHIIDPRLGEPPASGPASVTVLAPTGEEADALSTALYLMGPEAGGEWLKGRPEIGAIFVVEGPRVSTYNVSAADFRPAAVEYQELAS